MFVRHKICWQARHPLLCLCVRRDEGTLEAESTGRVNWASIWDLLFPQHLHPGWSQPGSPSHLPWELLPRKIPSTASQWRRLNVFWYILDKHLLVVFIQKLEILGVLHVDSFLQLTQQQFVYQYWWLTLVDLRGCLWPRFRVRLRSLLEDPRAHAWHYQIVTHTDPQMNRYY